MNGVPVEESPISDDHRIVRYCKFTSLENGEPGPTSFARKPDEAYVSVNDADMFDDAELKDRVSKSKALILPWLRGMGKNGLLAVSSARDVRAIEASPSLEAKYHPIAADAARPANPFHGGIWHVPTEAEMETARASVLIALAETAKEWWKASDV